MRYLMALGAMCGMFATLVNATSGNFAMALLDAGLTGFLLAELTSEVAQ